MGSLNGEGATVNSDDEEYAERTIRRERALAELRGQGWRVKLTERTVVRSLGDARAEEGAELLRHLPKGFVEAYERACDEAYARERTEGVGDASVIRGLENRVSRTSSGQTVGAVPAARRGQGRRSGLNTRSVLKGSERALRVKRDVDKKLRRLARDIVEELAGLSSAKTTNRCKHCGRVGDESWRYCPADGKEMAIETAP